jgi:hypothetical protein
MEAINNYLPVAIIVIFTISAISWIIRLVLFFVFRSKEGRKRDGGKKNIYENEPMGLPKGAIRTFLVFIFSILAILAIFGDLPVDGEDKKWVLLEFGGILTFYFGSRVFESYIDSRAKIKAIEQAGNATEATEIYEKVYKKE